MLILHGMLRHINFGDILMAQISLRWINEITDEPVRAVWATPDVLSVLGIRNARVPEFMRASAGVLSGGGYFQIADSGLPAARRFVRNTAPIRALQVLRRPTAVLSAGILPIEDSVLRGATRRLFAASETVCARDPSSFAAAKQIAPSARTTETADMVFSISARDIPEYAQRHAAAVLAKVAGKALHGIHLCDTPDRDARYAPVYAGLLARCKDTPGRHYLLLEDKGGHSGSTPAQRALHEQLGPAMSTIVPYAGTWELIALLHRLRSVLTDKLHVGLVAAAVGTPPFSVARHPKNLPSYDAIGLPLNCLLLGAPDAAERTPGLLERFLDPAGEVALPDHLRDAALLNRDRLAHFLANAGLARDQRGAPGR